MRARKIKSAACIGAGVIGAGWAARFALAGIDVNVADPSPRAAAAVDEALAAARSAWRRLTLSPPPTEGSVRVMATLEEAVADVDFVQESVPEREEIKCPLLARLDSLLAADVVVASSTSGLLPTRLQADMQQPQRFCIGHPFNPVYLLPLVEVCGGEQTTAETKNQAADFYRTLGMSPLLVRREIDGFVADRMMEALWREALWLLHDGVATVAEIDEAVRLGCGLRWSFMGPFMTYRLGGGEGGMRHFMEQFAPSLKLPWTKLMDTPELDETLLEKIISQSDEQAAGRTAAELIRQRDDCLIAVMQGLRANNVGAGALLRDYENQRYEQTHPQPLDESETPATPLALHQTSVPAEWIDYNGHMTESRYLQLFGDTTDALLHLIGIDTAAAELGSYYTVETHLRHLAEALVGEQLSVVTQVLAADQKRLHVFHTLRRDEVIVATAEHMLLHVREGRATPADAAVLARLQRIVAAHETMPKPEGCGRFVGGK